MHLTKQSVWLSLKNIDCFGCTRNDGEESGELKKEFNLHIIKKIVEYLLYGLLVFMALLVLASALPIPGGIKTFVVRSGSMEPKIKTGSVVVVSPKSDYKVGDVVTYGPNTKAKAPTTHRIISESGTPERKFFLTKGDANNTPDTREISKREIIGKVMLSIPYFGYVVATAQKPAGFAVIVGIPALLIIGDQFMRITREIKAIRNRPVKSPQSGGLPTVDISRGKKKEPEAVVEEKDKEEK